jgi:hypothetical protein
MLFKAAGILIFQRAGHLLVELQPLRSDQFLI